MSKLRAVLTSAGAYRRETANISWLVGDRVVRVFGTFLIGLCIARLLGPVDFGGYSYALTLIALLTLIVSLGLNGTVVKYVLEQPDDSHHILGTAFLLQATAAAVVVSGLAICAFWPGARGDDYAHLALIMALGLLFKPSEPIRYWFESQVSAKYAVLADNIAFAVGATLKISCLLFWRSLEALAWATAAEIALGGLFLVVIYRWRLPTQRRWAASRSVAGMLVKATWPLLLAGLSIALYTRIDQVILMRLSGPAETGVFSAAARISEMAYVLPTVIASSFFPRWQLLLRESGERHAAAVQAMMAALVAVCVVASLAMLWAAPAVVRLLYGEAYAAAAPVLAIHIWTCAFVCLGVLGNQWYLSHDLQDRTLICTVLGASAAVGLNFVLVPRFGAQGAAAASVAAQAISAFLADAISTRSRPLFWIKARAIISPLIWVGTGVGLTRSLVQSGRR